MGFVLRDVTSEDTYWVQHLEKWTLRPFRIHYRLRSREINFVVPVCLSIHPSVSLHFRGWTKHDCFQSGVLSVCLLSGSICGQSCIAVDPSLCYINADDWLFQNTGFYVKMQKEILVSIIMCGIIYFMCNFPTMIPYSNMQKWITPQIYTSLLRHKGLKWPIVPCMESWFHFKYLWATKNKWNKIKSTRKFIVIQAFRFRSESSGFRHCST